jgi:hypothetical protein
MTRPTSIGFRKLSNSGGEATVTVGTVADGAGPAGTGAALIGGAALAGVVRRDGTDGGIQAARWLDRRGQAARWPVLRGQAGLESSVRDRFPRGCQVSREPDHFPAGHDVARHALLNQAGALAAHIDRTPA